MPISLSAYKKIEARPPKIVKVAIGIVTDGQRLLIARRPANVPLGGYWEFPGGKLEPGETAEDAVRRELLEELALTVKPIRRLPPFTHAYEHAIVELTPIFCHIIVGQPRPVACDECRWIAPADLPNYTFPPANADLLATLQTQPLPTPPSSAKFG